MYIYGRKIHQGLLLKQVSYSKYCVMKGCQRASLISNQSRRIFVRSEDVTKLLIIRSGLSVTSNFEHLAAEASAVAN